MMGRIRHTKDTMHDIRWFVKCIFFIAVRDVGAAAMALSQPQLSAGEGFHHRLRVI